MFTGPQRAVSGLGTSIVGTELPAFSAVQARADGYDPSLDLDDEKSREQHSSAADWQKRVANWLRTHSIDDSADKVRTGSNCANVDRTTVFLCS